MIFRCEHYSYTHIDQQIFDEARAESSVGVEETSIGTLNFTDEINAEIDK